MRVEIEIDDKLYKSIMEKEVKIGFASSFTDRFIDAIHKGNERKTGKWAVNEVGVIRCPFCHANMNPRKNRKPKYCDECGAKIEGE